MSELPTNSQNLDEVMQGAGNISRRLIDAPEDELLRGFRPIMLAGAEYQTDLPAGVDAIAPSPEHPKALSSKAFYQKSLISYLQEHMP